MYRRLRSLTAHHSTVNQFQPHLLLRSVARQCPQLWFFELTEAQSIYNNSGGLSMQKNKNPTSNRENRNSATVGFRFDYKLTVTLF